MLTHNSLILWLFENYMQVGRYFNDAFMDIWNDSMKDDFINLTMEYPNHFIWVSSIL